MTQQLVNGGLYLVRWKVRPEDGEDLALFITDVAEFDEDETPTEHWAFFGEGMDCYQIKDYEVVSRVDVVPVKWDSPQARTWIP